MLNSYVTKVVIAILKKSLEARDEWILCVKHFHDFEMSIGNISKEEYYDAIFDKRLSSIKTIERLWRKVQEDIPELRGKDWELRQLQGGAMKKAFIMKANGQLDLFDELDSE